MVTKSGVSWYTEAEVKIYFPEGHVCCDLCPLMHGYGRKQCARTGEYLLDSSSVGLWCPLKFEGSANEKGSIH